MSNIYLFYGPDTFRAALKLQEWKKAFVAKFGKGTLREITTDSGKLRLSDNLGGSLFNATSLFVIRDPFSEEGGVDTEDFLNLVEKGTDSNNHILLWQRGSLDKRLNLTKKILDLGKSGKIKLQEFAELTESEALKFIASELGRRNLQIKQDAGELFFSYNRTENGMLDSGRALNSLKQLVSFCEDKKIVTIEDVETIVPAGESGNAFLPLLQSFARRERAKFYEHLNQMVNQSGSEQELLGIISALFEQVKNMILVQDLLDQKKNADQIDEILGFKKGRARFLSMDAKRFKRPELEAMLEELINIEYNTKQGKTVLAPALSNFAS